MSEKDHRPIERWSDDELLRAASAGNEEAFQVFCARSLPGLVRYLTWQCARCGIPKDLASDFAQETLLKAIMHVRTYREDTCRPLPKVSIAWLSQIGYHVVIDWVRANRRAKQARKVIGEAKTSRPTEDEVEQLEEVYKFYTWLPPREQEIIELILIEGLHPLEAGQRLGLTQATAYKAYERAVSHLRCLIREHGSLADGHFDR